VADSHAASSSAGSGSSKPSGTVRFGNWPKVRGFVRAGEMTATGRPWLVIVTDSPVLSTSANTALRRALASVLEIVFTNAMLHQSH
jgi:hypothetical protein